VPGRIKPASADQTSQLSPQSNYGVRQRTRRPCANDDE